MKTIDRWSSLVLGLFVLHVLAYQSYAAPSYTIQDLGVDDAVKAAGPNSLGYVAVRSGFGHARSFRIIPNVTVGGIAGPTQNTECSNCVSNSLGLLPGGDYTTANAINDSGTIVGAANSTTTVRPIIWTQSGALQDLGTLPGDSGGEAFGINNSGAVVGYSSGPQGTRTFLWTPKDGMQSLSALVAGEISKAFGISDNGFVVGSSGSPMGTHAVLWNGGRVQDLGTLSGDTTSEAFAVNNSGKVVGYSSGPAGVRAFAWTSQTGMQVLEALPSGTFSRAFGINSQGDVVGTSGSFDGPRAVLWSGTGKAQDLNTLVAVPVGMTLGMAVGINNIGQILVLSRNEMEAHQHHEGFDRLFLLTPTGP